MKSHFCAQFETSLCGLDEMLYWINHILESRFKNKRQCGNVDLATQNAFLSILLFERVSNIIEHRALGLSKAQVYENTYRYIQYIWQRKPIFADLKLTSIRFYLFLRFSFITRHSFRCPNTIQKHIGGRGKIILKRYFKRAKTREIYQNNQCILTFQGRVDDRILL